MTTKTKEKVDIKALNTDAAESMFLSLVSESANAKESPTMKNFLTMVSKQYKYSWHNLCLIYSQKKDASFVASYSRWQEIFKSANIEGAYIKPKSGIKVLVPMFYKDKETGEQKMFFGTGNVHDISDVVGFDLSQLENVNPVCEDTTTLYNTAKEVFLKKVPNLVSIHEQDLGGGTLGGYVSKDPKDELHIVVHSEKTDGDKFRTLIHEVAHSLLHVNIHKKDRTHDVKSVMEVEAESISYVVSTHLGLDSSDSAFYTASWNDTKDMSTSMKVIVDTAKKIIDMLS